VFALHLVGGITACSYKRAGPRLVTAYAVLALLLAVSDIILSSMLIPQTLHFENSYVTMHSVRESMMVRTFIEVMCVPWPVVALILMNTRGAKAACGAAT
jgi:hypothetical protein